MSELEKANSRCTQRVSSGNRVGVGATGMVYALGSGQGRPGRGPIGLRYVVEKCVPVWSIGVFWTRSSHIEGARSSATLGWHQVTTGRRAADRQRRANENVRSFPDGP